MYQLPDEFDMYNTLRGGFPLFVNAWQDVEELFELIENHDLLLQLNIDYYLN